MMKKLLATTILAAIAAVASGVETQQTNNATRVNERRDGTFGAVQVCWELSRDNEEREINGALRAMERFGLKEAVLVTRDQSDLISEGGRIIRVVPAWKWLCESGSFGL